MIKLNIRNEKFIFPHHHDQSLTMEVSVYDHGTVQGRTFMVRIVPNKFTFEMLRWLVLLGSD